MIIALVVLLTLQALLASADPIDLTHPENPDGDPNYRVAEDSLYFWLYTRNAPNDPQRLRPAQLQQVTINSNLPLKVLIHGWEDSIDAVWYEPTIEAYFNTRDVNVIALDWEKYALGNYISVMRAAEDVGGVVASLLYELHAVQKIPFSNIHIIGHSLGAHIAGFAGKQLLVLSGSRLGRITGLDPAGPGFNGNSASQRLANTDATFVDVIHTDGQIFGYGEQLGDADYYPNGGTAFQEGCWIWQIGCSHNRAPTYFTESISTWNAFIGRQCESESGFNNNRCSSNPVAVMGENAPANALGTYYLKTRNSAPFGRGESGA